VNFALLAVREKIIEGNFRYQMKKLFIIKTGTTFPGILAQYGDFDTWTINNLGPLDTEVSVVDVEQGKAIPAITDCAGVIITGSHAMVTDELLWSTNLEKWIPSLVKSSIPLLGVCYGHQLLAKSMDGQVGFHPKGKEIGTVKIQLKAESEFDPLFKAIPGRFHAHTSHSQTVIKLPPGAIGLAENAHDPHHAFRIGNLAWGVQFHPEYDPVIMRSYINEQAEELTYKGFDVAGLLRNAVDTPMAARVLRNFVRIVGSNRRER
jgi:GMP synthase (glutamine-hydrolysing)